MDWLLLHASSLALFLLRDAALLRTNRGRAWIVWALVQAAVFAALGIAAESISRERALSMLRAPEFWIPAVAFHAALWLGVTLARRASNLERTAQIVAAVPSPMFLFSAGAVVWLALTRVSGIDGWAAGLTVCAAWLLAVRSVAMLRRGPVNTDAALQFAAATNLSAILLIPMQQSSDTQSAVTEAPLDWATTLLPLAFTASLVTLSYLFHRHRSARRAA